MSTCRCGQPSVGVPDPRFVDYTPCATHRHISPAYYHKITPPLPAPLPKSSILGWNKVKDAWYRHNDGATEAFISHGSLVIVHDVARSDLRIPIEVALQILLENDLNLHRA